MPPIADTVGKTERKTKAPDDPTIMVGGQPKIDVNATKLQINEFLKLHKVIRPSQGGKRKPLNQLREELKAGGHVVGVAGLSGIQKKGNISMAEKAEKERKEAEYKQLIQSNPQGFNVKNTFNILGFNNAPIPPVPSAAEIELSGYGGLPVNYSPPVSSVSSTQLIEDFSKGKTVGEMRDYLTTRVAVTAFRGMRKGDLRDLYNEQILKDKSGGYVTESTDSEDEEKELDLSKTLSDYGSSDEDLASPAGSRMFGNLEKDQVYVDGKLYERFIWGGEIYWGSGGGNALDVYDKPGGEKIGVYLEDPDNEIIFNSEPSSEEETSSDEETSDEETSSDEEQEQRPKSLKEWNFEGVKYYIDENYTDERDPPAWRVASGDTMKVKYIYKDLDVGWFGVPPEFTEEEKKMYDNKPIGYLVENSKYAPAGETGSVVWDTLYLKFEHEKRVFNEKKSKV